MTAFDWQLGQNGVGGSRKVPQSPHCGATRRLSLAAVQNGSVLAFTAIRMCSPGMVPASVAAGAFMTPSQDQAADRDAGGSAGDERQFGVGDLVDRGAAHLLDPSMMWVMPMM